MTNVEGLREKWLEAKEAYWQLIRERVVLNEVTKNKEHPSGNLNGNVRFEDENRRFDEEERRLGAIAEGFRRQILGLKNEKAMDCYDGYIVCCKCKGMFQYLRSEEDKKTHTFNSCKQHENRILRFTAQDLEELWTK